MIEERLAARPAAAEATPGARPTVPEGCITSSDIAARPVFKVKRELEFCLDDGEVKARISSLYIESTTNGFVDFSIIGGGSPYRCSYGEKCQFAWIKGKYFVVERILPDEKLIQVRFKNNDS